MKSEIERAGRRFAIGIAIAAASHPHGENRDSIGAKKKPPQVGQEPAEAELPRVAPRQVIQVCAQFLGLQVPCQGITDNESGRLPSGLPRPPSVQCGACLVGTFTHRASV